MTHLRIFGHQCACATCDSGLNGS